MSPRRLGTLLISLTALLMLVLGLSTGTAFAQPRPTIVLVHGAFADATSWDGVAADLRGRGYTVVTPDNPLRGPGYDAAAVEAQIADVDGPILLVGHSYGGAVISNIHDPDVTGLVYIAAFGPVQYEPVMLNIDPIRFPGSQLLPPALQLKVVDDATVPGGRNLDGYVAPEYFQSVFAQDVDAATIQTMIAHQKSAALWGNMEPSGAPSWAHTPSWYLVAGQDRVIPPSAQRFMAQRMGAQTSEAVASHAVLVSQPDVVADLVATAAG